MADEQNAENREKKIHVDEDWKKSVQEEKERLRAEQQTEAQTEQSAPEAAAGRPDEPGAGQMPEPSVQMLVADFYQQALIALGVIENPITNERTRVPRVASYLIDLIALLQEKMEGNLTAQEEKYLTSVLHDLRMRYISPESENASAEGGEEQAQE
jgi:hypothetical protein